MTELLSLGLRLPLPVVRSTLARYFEHEGKAQKLEDDKWYMLVVDFEEHKHIRRWFRYYMVGVPDSYVELSTSEFERKYNFK